MKRALTTSHVLLAAALGAGAAPADDASAEERAIREVDRAWSAALERKDLEGVMAVYAEDALFLPPNAPLVEGRAGIRDRFARRMALPGYAASFVPTRIVVARSGDMAYEHGTFSTRATDPQGRTVVRTGKHLVTWSKRDGHWRVAAESINYDAE
jgi:uncharacterized protein (TIGR02246 family)